MKAANNWLVGFLAWKLVSALAKFAWRGIGKGFLALKAAAAARRERKRAAIPGGGAPGGEGASGEGGAPTARNGP